MDEKRKGRREWGGVHNVTLRWEGCEHVHLRREPRGGQEKGTTVARATTFIGRMKMGLWGKNQP